MSAHLEVVRAGPLTTVQDRGRFGLRFIGVSPSGAADREAMARANALVGNQPEAAVLEATFGHAVLRAGAPLRVAITGAVCPGVPMDVATPLAAGQVVALGPATAGVRAYIAVAGGIAVPPVLGSRCTDTLSGLGPAPLRDGEWLPIGAATVSPSAPPEPPAVARPAAAVAVPCLALTRGPRDGWLSEATWAVLATRTWEVSPDSNRVAVRLRGAKLEARDATIAPEPLVRGAVQLPPDGMPIVFLADHPVTGGYPVVGVLDGASCDALAQCRPGSAVTLSERP